MPQPDKPYPGFPRFAHATGWWVKRIRGRLRYVNKSENCWQTELIQCQDCLDDLHAGRTPRKTR